MADKTIDLEATDLFSLGTNFNTQSSSSNAMQDWPNALGATGDVECESEVNNRTEYSQSTVYCNATPAIGTDLATFLTQFGNVENSKAVTGLTITFAAGEYATVDVEGHNHDDNAHSALDYADVSDAIPAGAGLGCPDIFANSDTDSSPVNVTVAFSLNHIDREGADGEHFVGKNTTFRCDVTAEYIGVPTLTTTDWSIDSEDTSDNNQNVDGYTITAHRFFDMNVA